MTFDLSRMQMIYSAIIASIDNGEFADVDSAIVAMVLDLNDLALASITELQTKNARIAELENACRSVGAH